MRIKTFGLVVSAGLLLAGCGQQVPGAAQADPSLSAAALPSGTSVCFYEHINYAGSALCAGADGAWIGRAWNDRVSSVRVQSGFQVELFKDINFAGGSLKLSADTPSLVARNFNDLTSSYKISKTGGGGGGGGGALPAPPQTIRDRVVDRDVDVNRVFHDNDIAVYFGPGMDPSINWMNTYLRDAWRYTQQVYGGFGPDPRLYIVAHKDAKYSFATVNNYFDAGFGYRNVLDLGGSWDWQNPTPLNFEVMTHEMAHIVEGASNATRESPSFEVWGDSKWAEIFIYDVYKALGRDAEAQDWYSRMTNTAANFPRANTYWFRDWFYPVYSGHGGSKVLSRYFSTLSQCFPKQDFAQGKEYTRRMNMGEFVHFWSGAAGVNLKAQATKAFGWSAAWEGQFTKAQNDFGCAKYPR